MSEPEKKNKKNRGGNICSVQHCHNTSYDSVSLHHLPRNPQQRKQWIRFIERTRSNLSEIPKDNIIVCSDHFTDSDYKNSPALQKSLGFSFKPVLKSGIVPSIYPTIISKDPVDPVAEQKQLEKKEKTITRRKTVVEKLNNSRVD